MSLISRVQAVLIVVFSTVETVGLTAWLYLLIPDLVMSPAGGLAITLLFIFLLVEHFIATVSGNKPPKP